MRKYVLALILAAAPGAAFGQFCSNCITNSAAPQNAQMNIGTATIRGTLTVGTLVLSNFSASTITANVFIGSGTFLTNLNASQLLLGTVPSARVSGSYTGITGVGALTAGTWNGTPIAPQYGGTGQNWVAVSTGSIIYFNGNGTMTTLSPGTPEALLQTNGNAAPVWTSSPAVSGLNIYGINPFQLAGGSLPTNVLVSSNSISYVNAASVYGTFGPGVSFSSFTGTILLTQLSTGTLPNSVVASSITGTGVAPGTYGSPGSGIGVAFTVGSDGRLSSASQTSLTIAPSQISGGTFGGGVYIAAAGVASGNLGGAVVASSIAASGVTPGVYGNTSNLAQLTITGDGRVTSATNIPLAVAAWTIGSQSISVTNPALSVVVQSTLTVQGAGFSVGGSTFVIAGGSATFAYGVTAGSFSGVGTNLTKLTPANFNAGYLPSTVIASSVNVAAIGAPQLAAHAVSTNTWDGIAQTSQGGTGNNWSAIATGALPYFSGTGAMSALAPGTNGETLVLSGGLPVWATAASSATDLAGGAAGSLPYQSAPNITTFLPASVNGYALQQTAGIPAWVAAVSSATNLAGGATGGLHYQSAANTSAFLAAGTNGYSLIMSAGLPAWATSVSSASNIVGGLIGQIPYQSAANTTALLAAGTQNYVLQANGAGAPSWVSAASSATNIAGGAANSLPYQTAANTTAMLAQGTGVLQEIAGVPGWTQTPTLTTFVSTGTSVSVSTMIITQNSVAGAIYAAGYYPSSPLVFVGNTNTYLQLVGQNLSNGASASTDLSLTNDLGSDTSYYFNAGINSSKFSIAGQSAEVSSSAYVTSSDSDLVVWAGTNGGLYGAKNERLIFGSSNPVTGNIAGYLLPATTTGPGAWVLLSSMTNTSAGGELITYGLTAATGTFTQGITAASGTITGNAFSVGGSTLVVSGGKVGIGTTSPISTLEVQGVFTSSSTTPTIICTAGTGVLISPSSSNRGRFTPGTAATACTITFAGGFTFPYIPSCFCNNEASATLPVIAQPATTSVTCAANSAITGDTISYGCF